MKEFKKSKGKKIDVKIDGKAIYLNLTSGNMADFTRLAKTIDESDENAMFELAEKLFMPESYELVRFLDIDDFVAVLEVAVDVLEKEKDSLESRFKRADQ